jgi:hypothetical protein
MSLTLTILRIKGIWCGVAFSIKYKKDILKIKFKTLLTLTRRGSFKPPFKGGLIFNYKLKE